MFTIGDLVAEFGVSRRTIVRWTTLGILPRPQRPAPNEAAVYGAEAVNRLREITAEKGRTRSLRDWHDRFNPDPT